MSKKTYYEILGIPPSATEEEIKKAYRKQAKRYHPDVCQEPHAEQRFKEIKEAYETLGDAEQRRRYDAGGFSSPSSSFSSKQGGGNYGGFSASDYQDIFGNVFGGQKKASPSSSSPSPKKGEDIFVTADISLEESAQGTKLDIDIQRTEACDTCKGVGHDPSKPSGTCPACQGKGHVEEWMDSPFGKIAKKKGCAACQGKGKVLPTKCPTCNGNKRMLRKRKIALSIPPGSDMGTILRVSGEGHMGFYGGAKGDIRVELFVKPHPVFEREGLDIYSKRKIGVATASLGGDIPISTVWGEAMLTISPGTQHGTKFTLSGKGISHQGKQGHHVVEVHLSIPTTLTSRQKELFEELKTYEKEG